MKLLMRGGLSLLAMLVFADARADAPDPTNSTATTSGGAVLTCPAADGQTMASAGATVFINLRDALDVPCDVYNPSWIWLVDPPGDILECFTPPGTHPANGPDINGNTQIDGVLGTGGWTQAGLQVYLGPLSNRFPLNGPLLPIDLNSPDITGDGLVDLADWNLIGADFSSFAYEFRSDFNHDLFNDVADLATMAAHICHSCDFFIPLSAVTAEGSIGIFFDTDGPPYTERTMATPLGVPVPYFVVVEGIPGLSAIDAPLSATAGAILVNRTAAAGGFGVDPILFGLDCIGATGQTVIETGHVVAVAPGPQVISFDPPLTSL